MADQPLILLVEDREDDAFLIRKAFERTQVHAAIQVVRDGEEAISYLSGVGRYRNRAEYPLPWLVLLDLKMPRVDGFEVLKWIRQESDCKSLVVVVLTSSEQMRDVETAYALGANSFLLKPLDFENTTALAEAINRYWLHWNRLPENVRRHIDSRKTNDAENGD
jgi:CheY-like chemotaxis protein